MTPLSDRFNRFPGFKQTRYKSIDNKPKSVNCLNLESDRSYCYYEREYEVRINSEFWSADQKSLSFLTIFN